MEYKNIKIFLEIVKNRSLSKTAENMFLSQSTISHRLKSLEDELGYKLVTRSKGKRTVSLTQQGKEFVQLAQKWKNIFEETTALKEKNHKVIRIAVIESAFYEFISDFTIEFVRKNEDIKLSVSIADSADIYDMMENGLIDFGFASFELYRDNVMSECINHQKLGIIKYCTSSEENNYINTSKLDISKQIKLTGGNFSNFDVWYEKYFKTPTAYLISINGVRGCVEYLKAFKESWALCPKHFAKALSEKFPIKYYELDNPPENRKLYLLYKDNRDSSLKDELFDKFYAALKSYLDL